MGRVPNYSASSREVSDNHFRSEYNYMRSFRISQFLEVLFLVLLLQKVDGFQIPAKTLQTQNLSILIDSNHGSREFLKNEFENGTQSIGEIYNGTESIGEFNRGTESMGEIDDGTESMGQNFSTFTLIDNRKEKRSTNEYGGYPQRYKSRYQWKEHHTPQKNFHHSQGNSPKMGVRNKFPYSSNSMSVNENKPNFQKYHKFDSDLTTERPKENYNFLSNNFINHDPGNSHGISSSSRERDKEFPDKIVKDGQVFYRHDVNQVGNNQHRVDENLDREQADGAFKIFQEMSHDNEASGKDDLSKGFDLLLDHVKQAKEKSPSISAAIAGAAIRGTSKGSFSHVIGSAVNGGYFAASAKGYDDKGGSIHSHIQGTGKKAGGGASAIAPGRDGEAFIQVDNSESGLSIGQSSTYNGEAFVIADVDKDSKYHFEHGDNTSSFADKNKNDSFGFSFGEAKSKLYAEDAPQNNAAFKNKHIPKYNSELDENKETKPFRMGLVENIMEKVHQPGTDDYFRDIPNGNDYSSKPTLSFENYTKIYQPGSLIKSDEKTSSQEQKKGVVGLVTFPFNKIGSPPGPGELLTQAPDTIIQPPMNHEENFENYFEELPYYDTNINGHNYDYYTNKDLKFEGKKQHNQENVNNYTQSHNWVYHSEATVSTNGLPKEHDTSTERSYSEENLAYQPFSSVLIDSYNNRHLLPPSITSEDQNRKHTYSENEFSNNSYENNFTHFSEPKYDHQESDFIRKNMNEYDARNLHEPSFKKPQVSKEVALDTDYQLKNIATSSHDNSFNFLPHKNYEVSTRKYHTLHPQKTGAEDRVEEIQNTNINYPYYNQDTKDVFSNEHWHVTEIPHVKEIATQTPNHVRNPETTIYPFLSAMDYDHDFKNLQESSFHKNQVSEEGTLGMTRPNFVRTRNNPETAKPDFTWNSVVTSTERAQVITPGITGHIQHLNASEPGLPNIRVLTVDNSESRKFYQREGTSIGPGEKIPGAPGYRIPPGFRGRVVLGHQLPVNVESKRTVKGYNALINLTPQRPYAGPVFASVSGPEAASKINPSIGRGVHLTLSSPTIRHSTSRQRQHNAFLDNRKNAYTRKSTSPTSNYRHQNNKYVNNSKQRAPAVVKNSNGQCGYYVNECVRLSPFFRDFCSQRFIIVECCC